MRILCIHNSHRSGSASGDDNVFHAESKLLEKYGHTPIKVNPINDAYDRSSVFEKSAIILQIPWSFQSYSMTRELVVQNAPDIIHIHNFFPFVSPSVFWAAYRSGMPVVQTLHDFRLLCPAAFLLRDKHICRECFDNSYLRCIRYGCFKKSKLRSIMPGIMNYVHRFLGTYKEKIDGYICLSESQKQVFCDAGFDERKMYVKPNFVEDVRREKEYRCGHYVIYVGRLSWEKGLDSLIHAWQDMLDIPLKVVGDGPDANVFKQFATKFKIRNIEFLGYVPHSECMKILHNARFLIMPSLCYETFGLAIAEAFCRHKPVIAANLGAMADIVNDGNTGLLFKPNNHVDLATKVRWLWDHPKECCRMGENARKEYEAKYTPERNYLMLMGIYEKVIAMHKRRA